MSQHTFAIANEAGAAFRGDVNSALQALASQSSGAAAPGTTYAYQVWADTTTSTLKRRNAANSAWIARDTLDETFVLSRAANTILGASDRGKTIVATATFTQTLTAAATLVDGWEVDYQIQTGATITFDPNAAENIDGAATKVITGPSSGRIKCNGSAFFTVGFDNVTGSLGRMAISGLSYGNGDGAGAGDLVNDITIAVGAARDATNVKNLVLASAITKQLDAAWAVGTAAGGLDTGAIGNSDYYIWLIMRSDTGVVDVLFSLSSTAPTMPGAGAYDYKRLIGWFKRVAATIVAFHTYETEGGGLEMNWDAPTLDINLANTLTTARRSDAVKVPLNFSVLSKVDVLVQDAANQASCWVGCPDETDVAPSQTAARLMNASVQNANAQGFTYELWIRTSATGTIAARSNLATVDLYNVSTVGFRWARRN